MDDVALLTQMNIQLRSDEKMDTIMTDDQVRQRIITMLGDRYTALVFSSESGDVIGYTLTDHSRTPMYLRQLFVKKELRREGFGREMMHTTMRHLKTAELDIEVMVWNESARVFYGKIGCRERYIGLRYELPR
jgi:ribosomal protein S18 acetylase RimI-like enzyme